MTITTITIVLFKVDPMNQCRFKAQTPLHSIYQMQEGHIVRNSRSYVTLGFSTIVVKYLAKNMCRIRILSILTFF